MLFKTFGLIGNSVPVKMAKFIAETIKFYAQYGHNNSLPLFDFYKLNLALDK